MSKAKLSGLPPTMATQLMLTRPRWLQDCRQNMLLARASDGICAALAIHLECVCMPPQGVAATGNRAYILKRGCLCANGYLVTLGARVVSWGGNDFFFQGFFIIRVCFSNLRFFWPSERRSRELGQKNLRLSSSDSVPMSTPLSDRPT